MATIAKWEKEMSWVPVQELKEIEKALRTLDNWDIFTKEFGRMLPLSIIAKNIITNRSK